MGMMVERGDVFNSYLDSVKADTSLLAAIKRVFTAIADLFKREPKNQENPTIRLEEMIEQVNALIAAAEKMQAEAEMIERIEGQKKRSEKADGKTSLIGEIGASALDMAEEATFRMDNLAIARQMEERGDSALDIRMATGWERGADGLWRYELMDAEVNLYDGNETAIRKKIEVAEEAEKDFMQQSKADTKELRERTNTYLAEMREKYGVAEGDETDAMTEEEIAHLQSLTGKEIAFEDYKERRRNDLYNRRMALEAQLGYVKVKNTDSDAMIQTTRLGHILQGENADALFTAYPSLRDMEVQLVTDIRDGAFAAYATKGGYKRIELNAKKTPVDMLTYYLMHEVQHAIQDVEGFASGGNLSSLQNNGEVTAKEAYDYYRKIAGEVEARNVSARLNMSAEERMNTLLSETEDVAREDQIFIRDGVEMAMAAKKRGATKRNTPKLGQPTTANGNPPVANLGTKLNKNYENAIEAIENLIREKGTLSAHEFLYELDNALTGLNEASIEGSDYIDIGDGFTIRVSDHYSNANTFKRFNNTEKNFGVVIKLKNRKFKSDPNVDYVEVVYYPDKLDSNRQLSILEGVKGLVETKDIGEMPEPDDTHTSEKTNFSLISPEMDAAYLSAVERGDMATAQQMVLEAAKLAGYSSDESWRMAHRAPRNEEDNVNPFNTELLVPEDFWTHPEWYTQIRYNSTDRESYNNLKPAIDKYKRLVAEGKQKEADTITVTMYRGVDKRANSKEASFRNGDWITPSREYAKMSAPYGNTRVIKKDVLLKNIWWDGNSINEWGYDDGAEYAYKDAKNNRKLLDPVTYDDNGNVIPLSERFNPEKEDIRYSLSDRPTGLLTDFTEEFEALQREYTSLDPTAIHAQHPFRIRKRKVVQKYLNHVTEVLGNNVENIVYDKTNNAHIKRAYDRIVAANGTFKNDVSFIEFKEYLQSQPVEGAFIKGTNIIVYDISTDNRNNSQVDILNSYVHENVHRIIEKLGIDSKTLEDILDEGLSLLPNITNAYIDGYQSCPKFEQGEETLAYSIGDRMSPPKIGMRLLRVIEGYITFEEFNATQKKLLPLRDSYIEKILNELQNEYKARREGADYNAESANRGGVNGEDKGEAKKVYDRRWRGYSETKGYTRRSVLDEERAEILSNANAKQKTPDANIDNDLYTFDEARFSLRDDIDARIAKKRPDILPEERMEAVEYIMSRGDMGCVEVINWGAQRNRANDTSQIVLVVSLSQKRTVRVGSPLSVDICVVRTSG